MQVDLIAFEQTFNTGNFTNQKVRMEATLDEDEDPAEATARLRALVQDQDPAKVHARAVLAAPDQHAAWEIKQAHMNLDLPVPARLEAEITQGRWPAGPDAAGTGGPF